MYMAIGICKLLQTWCPISLRAFFPLLIRRLLRSTRTSPSSWSLMCRITLLWAIYRPIYQVTSLTACPSILIYCKPDSILSLNRPLGCLIESNEPCKHKAVVYNKMGAKFSIPVPNKGFVFRDIVFDGIDSVIDYLNTTADSACVNGTDKVCCKVSSNSMLQCEQYDDSTTRLRPMFNK